MCNLHYTGMTDRHVYGVFMFVKQISFPEAHKNETNLQNSRFRM